MRRTYNPVKRVSARSEGPNPSAPAQSCYHHSMKVEKQKFDEALARLLKAKPKPREKIKTTGQHGPKTPILSKA